MQTRRLDSGCALGQAGQPFPQLAQLKQPDVQQLCGPAHLGSCPLPLDPGLLQAALRGPQLVLQLCVSGFQILQGEGRQSWGPQKVSRVQHLKAGARDHSPHSGPNSSCLLAFSQLPVPKTLRGPPANLN